MEKQRCYGCMELTDKEVCPKCGWQRGQDNESHQLPVGTVLRDKYLIGRVLGQGGFGITYMAWDMDLELQVCVKEFYPSTAVNRDSTHNTAVTCNTPAMEAGFLASRERFLREARSLAKFREIPQIVSLYDFFQMNNTAYMVMEFVKGIDMAKLVRNRGGKLSMEEILRILEPVMDALQKVHEAGLIHRDISPDNIMLHPVEGAKLLDFGAVRTVASPDPEKELTRSTEAILKNGFAPMEQYVEKGSLGPWTDVYAMSASIFYCLTGRIPESAPSRMLEDEPFDWTGAQGITEEQKEVIAHGMALKAKDRIGSVRELKEALLAAAAPVVAMPEESGAGSEPMAVTEAIVSSTPQEETATPEEEIPAEEEVVEEAVQEKTAPKKKRRIFPAVAAVLLLIAAAVGGYMYWTASRIHVTGAVLEDATLERLLLEDYSAIGYYEVTIKLFPEKIRSVSFPIGAVYDGLEVMITGDDGTSTPAVTQGDAAVAGVAPQGCYLIQVRTAETAELSWTEWAEALPEGIELNADTVEVDIQYRDRNKEYAVGYSPTMEGWGLLESFPNNIPYGEWSDWSETEPGADENTEVEIQHQYRSRSFESFVSEWSDVPGWTLIKTEHTYEYGPWGNFQENPIVESENTDVEVETVWDVYVDCIRDGVVFRSFTHRQTAVGQGYYVGQEVYANIDGERTLTVVRDIVTLNLYRSRSKTVATTTYHYCRWTDWTEWDTIAAESSETVEVEERDMYRSREIYGDTAYRFWRWGPWSEWTLDAPGPENEEHEYEQRIVYRYIPQ